MIAHLAVADVNITRQDILRQPKAQKSPHVLHSDKLASMSTYPVPCFWVTIINPTFVLIYLWIFWKPVSLCHTLDLTNVSFWGRPRFDCFLLNIVNFHISFYMESSPFYHLMSKSTAPWEEVMVKARRKPHAWGGRRHVGKNEHLLPKVHTVSSCLMYRINYCQLAPETSLVNLWFQRMFVNPIGELYRILK